MPPATLESFIAGKIDRSRGARGWWGLRGATEGSLVTWCALSWCSTHCSLHQHDDPGLQRDPRADRCVVEGQGRGPASLCMSFPTPPRMLRSSLINAPDAPAETTKAPCQESTSASAPHAHDGALSTPQEESEGRSRRLWQSNEPSLAILPAGPLFHQPQARSQSSLSSNLVPASLSPPISASLAPFPVVPR